jgi:hypothetical protein
VSTMPELRPHPFAWFPLAGSGTLSTWKTGTCHQGHCCIEAKGVFVMHQSSEADPQVPWKIVTNRAFEDTLRGF